MTTQSGMPRWLWELLILLLIAALGYGAWWWLGVEHRGKLQTQKDTLAEQYEPRLRELERRLQAATAAEATAAATAFAAGIRPLVGEQRWVEVDRAVLEILELPGLAFVHVLGADGAVKISSDRKLLAVGHVGARGHWATSATGVVQRNSPPGLIEIAVPMGAGENRTVLWLGYRSDEPGALEPITQPAAEVSEPA